MGTTDWEALYQELATATTEWTRDELVELLRDLIREYVVERGLPTGTPAQAATPDLAAMDFPRLVTWLKRNLNHAELDLFSVDGQRVIVDADGPRVLTTRASAPAASPSAPSASAPAAQAQAGSPAPPRAIDDAEPEPDSESAPRRKLSKGFRGLEFD